MKKSLCKEISCFSRNSESVALALWPIPCLPAPQLMMIEASLWMDVAKNTGFHLPTPSPQSSVKGYHISLRRDRPSSIFILPSSCCRRDILAERLKVHLPLFSLHFIGWKLYTRHSKLGAPGPPLPLPRLAHRVKEPYQEREAEKTRGYSLFLVPWLYSRGVPLRAGGTVPPSNSEGVGYRFT